MAKRKKRHFSKKQTRFHIIPKARGGKGNKDNISRVRDDRHRMYHILFGLMTPDQVIAHLVKNYWNNQWFWVDKTRKQHEHSESMY